MSLPRYTQCHQITTSVGHGLAHNPAMDEFASHFCQNHDGSWTCMSAGEFNGPTGRIQVAPGSRFYRGTIFMGFDLAAWLDEELRNRTMRCESDQLAKERRHVERRRS